MESQATCALVTGAGTGVGRAVACALGSAGLYVTLAGRRAAPLREVCEAIQDAGGRAQVCPLDVGDPAAVAGCTHALAEAGKMPDVLVNNAGMYGDLTLIGESDPQRWCDTLHTNVCGPFLLARACMAPMIAKGWGRIVNVSSAASIAPPGALASAYQLSKVSLNWFTRQLAAELAGTGVTANAMHPGEVKTEMWDEIRRQADEGGEICEGARGWARMVGDTGGDDPELSARLVLDLIGPHHDETNGEFLWIQGGIQKPREAW